MEKNKKNDDGILFVGKKPTIVYVDALVNRLDRQNELTVIAMGINIYTAIDAIERAIKRYFKDSVEKTKITIDTHNFDDGGSVPKIEIVLKKK